MSDLEGRDEFEQRLARRLGRLLREQEMELLELLGDPPDLNNVPASFWEEQGEILAEALTGDLEAVFQVGAGALVAAQPVGVDLAIVNQNAANWARQYTFGLVRGINDTSRAALQAQVGGFFEAPVTLGELRERLAPTFGPVRAEMIAVTETTRAAVEGERAVVRQIELQGARMVAVWQTSNDEAVCPICGPRHGKRQGDGWNDFPPAHPRCRCWVNHEYVRD